MTAPVSFHTAEQSVFQSAFLEVLAEEAEQADGLEKSVFDAAGLGIKAEDDVMQTLANVLDPHAKGGGDLFSTMGVCVQHTLDLHDCKTSSRPACAM